MDSAAGLDLKTVVPTDTDANILVGYQAQRDLILDLYRSPHATVQEIAWGGGNTVSNAILKPLSCGVITVNSTGPTAAPVFGYRTFSHPTNLNIIFESIRKIREWMASAATQEIKPVETYPGANVTSDADIAEAIRNFALSTWAYPTGSCSMMPLKYGGVLDPQLRVYGVQSLRVVDASMMPMIIGSHTPSTVYAVAERVRHLLVCHEPSHANTWIPL